MQGGLYQWPTMVPTQTVSLFKILSISITKYVLGSQFFISYAAQPQLDLKYTLFGKVIDGLDTLDELEKLPVNSKNYKPLNDTRINSITIHANPLAG